MKIKKFTTTRITIDDAPGLDAIGVYLEDLGPGAGRVSIDCHGQAWTGYWGGMGERTAAEFFTRCDEHCLAGKMSNVRQYVFDEAQCTSNVRAEIVRQRKGLDIDKELARELYDEACDISSQSSHPALLHRCFGDEWYLQLPDKINPDYTYLCKIILAVQQALRLLAENEVVA